MEINGMKAEHIGVVGFVAPWKNPNGYAIYEDLWGTNDGKRYVEDYFWGDIVEYNWLKHGYIWFNEAIGKHANDQVEIFDQCAESINYQTNCSDEEGTVPWE
jgi:hypothetical protein